ncbi:hypothetical protein BO85DRAFT_102279 [Aspergillus piperis CBS 112811]|uniref:Uncharacterized protein n=1 Tax=Aspergillus piperis CBS 112811 TaxID=1448313 RepID=A0A8G1VLL8_9EURO|nr:hypothetical protein BO85DRAFT_102279 [Aspergillus piperis CBS 112811]RAH54848.1 hypothetical protein BO85DRAFT_102279 [Aspergillus piperis CBS 112811]
MSIARVGCVSYGPKPHRPKWLSRWTDDEDGTSGRLISRGRGLTRWWCMRRLYLVERPTITKY